MWQILKILIIFCIEFNNTTWSGAWSFSFQVRCDRRSEKRFWQMKNERCSGAAYLWDADGEDSVAQLFPHKQPKNLGRGELLSLVDILLRYFLEQVSHSQVFHQNTCFSFPTQWKCFIDESESKKWQYKSFLSPWRELWTKEGPWLSKPFSAWQDSTLGRYCVSSLIWKHFFSLPFKSVSIFWLSS